MHTFRETNRARRQHMAYQTFLGFWRRKGLRGAAAQSRARRAAERIHGPRS